jgi:glycerol-3-phosphate dehydrogenase (NAD(P)+)
MASTERGIGVIGAGSWGTALALQLARSGRRVLLWGRDRQAMQQLTAERVNTRYLPGRHFPPALMPEPDLARLGTVAADVVVAVPSRALREVLTALARVHADDRRLVLATKGLEQGTGYLPHQVAADVFPGNTPLAIVSGPTFAGELARQLPSALTIASHDTALAADAAAALHSPSLRVYTAVDVTGVALGGAVKNIIAIAAGIADGLGMGANARAALITRGLAEVTRLGIALGGAAETFTGLAGLGDLVLTCTDDQSRNRRMGLALARGEAPEAALRRIGQVVEGVYAAREVRRLAAERKVEMPITEQVARVLDGDVSPRAAAEALMTRSQKEEIG